MKAPVCPERYQELVVHEHQRIDPYYWLKDKNDQEVIKYLEQENAFFEAQMEAVSEIEGEIYDEIVGRISKKDSSVPFQRGEYYYYTCYEAEEEYAIYTRKKGSLEAQEEVLLNHNEIAKGKPYSSVGKVGVSADDEMLAYTEDEVSRRIYSLIIKVKSTQELIAMVEGVEPGFEWSSKDKVIFYVKKDLQTLRPYQVFKKNLDDLSAPDQLIFEEKDEGFYVSISQSKSKQFLLIESESFNSTSTSVLEMNTPDARPRLFMPRLTEHEYSIDHRPGSFYIRSNYKAKNFQLWSCPDDTWDQASWELEIGHRADTLLQHFELYRNRIVVEERKEGLIRFKCIENDRSSYYIPMPKGSYTAYTGTNVELDSPHFRFGFTSLVTPASVIDFVFDQKQKVIRKTQEVVGGYDEKRYHTELLMVPSKDEKSVPVSLVYNQHSYKKGKSPLLLYGYGSYGVVVDPAFSVARLSLLDRGFAFAIAHIRGGEYLGRTWYEEGKLLKKKNTFSDFIAVGRFLIQQGIVPADNLHAMGGSAGGLLMGAVLNESPQLWRSVVAAVPFVDVVTTMLDDTIPLTVGEYVEWGNPNEKNTMITYVPIALMIM